MHYQKTSDFITEKSTFNFNAKQDEILKQIYNMMMLFYNCECWFGFYFSILSFLLYQKKF